MPHILYLLSYQSLDILILHNHINITVTDFHTRLNFIFKLRCELDSYLYYIPYS